MKAKADKDTCIACGLCPTICGEVFQIGADGKAEAVKDEVPDHCEEAAQEAADSCPVNAIEVE